MGCLRPGLQSLVPCGGLLRGPPGCSSFHYAVVVNTAASCGMTQNTAPIHPPISMALWAGAEPLSRGYHMQYGLRASAWPDNRDKPHPFSGQARTSVTIIGDKQGQTAQSWAVPQHTPTHSHNNTPDGENAHTKIHTLLLWGTSGHNRGNANPAAHNLGNYRGAGEIVPFVNRTLEWGVVIATFVSVLSIVPRHCARF